VDKLGPLSTETYRPSFLEVVFLYVLELKVTYKCIRSPQIRVSINLNQPQPKVLIN